MKDKNLTSKFSKNESDVYIKLTSEYTVTTEDPNPYHINVDKYDTFLSGPAIDRLHEFEELELEPNTINDLLEHRDDVCKKLREFQALGMEPEDIKRLIEASEDDNDTIITLKNNIACLEKELDRLLKKKNDPVDIHKLIDEVREKKDCSVRIMMMGGNFTSVDIRPDEPGLPRWIQNGDYYTCPNCGACNMVPVPYCSSCGEQLGEPMTKQPEPKPKKMTCREKLAEEHPEKVNPRYSAGCYGCPHHHNYAPKPIYCGEHEKNCNKCWDREVEE